MAASLLGRLNMGADNRVGLAPQIVHGLRDPAVDFEEGGVAELPQPGLDAQAREAGTGRAAPKAHIRCDP